MGPFCFSDPCSLRVSHQDRYIRYPDVASSNFIEVAVWPKYEICRTLLQNLQSKSKLMVMDNLRADNLDRLAPAPTSEPGKLPERPEFEQPPKASKHKVWPLAALLLLLLILAGSGYYAYGHYFQAARKTASSPAIGAHPQTAHSAPPTEAATFGAVKVAYMTLPLTESQTFVNPVAGTGDIVVTANGHYLIRDPRGFTFDSKGNTGGNLLYDGKSVYNGQYLWQFALSANGQHYIYQLDTARNHSGGNAEIYVDGKLVQTVPDTNGVYYLRISNDGKHYAFATGKAGAPGDPYLVKDGHTIYTSTESIGDLNFDADLQHYVVVADPLGGGPGTHQVVLDGKMLYDGQPSALAGRTSAILSSNGQHVLYAAAGGAVYLDGRQILQSSAYVGAAAAVTDSGAYGVVNWVANKVTISNATYSIPSEFANVCSSGCAVAYPTFALSNNGQHYIFGTKQPNLWNIDGAIVAPVGNVEGVEFVGDTLYLYRWAQ